jgi:isoquinoline 1-oxidoreductase
METSESGLTRREFLGLTGGLIVFFAIPSELARAAGESGSGDAPSFNAFLRIAPDSMVTVFTGKVEMGQGNKTALAQMVAEELTVPFSSVEMVMGDTDLVPWDGGTWGSTSVRFMGVELRAAAAEARDVLVEMAAEQWGAAPSALTVSEGRISLASDTRTSVALGELTEGKEIRRALKGEPKLRPVVEYRVVGTSVSRVDGRAIVTGEEQFVADVRIPGMLHGAVLHPPSFGARLKSVDTSRAERASGVIKVVRDEGFVAVVAERPELAREARQLIRADWEEKPHPAMESLWDDLRSTAELADTVTEEGTVGSVLEAAERQFSATYRTAFVAHAPVEPHVALASWQDGKVTVYSNTQTPFLQKDDVAEALGLESGQVRIVVPRVGGGFGGKTNPELAIAAARLARAVGRPVMVDQTREEELTWNYFKPAALIDIRCGVNGDREISAWDCDVHNCGDRGAEPPYGFANRRVRSFGCDSPLRQGAWRGLAGSAITFAIEVHMDEVASEMGEDPVEFRLKHLDNDPRLARTVRAVAEAYGWTPRRAPTGKGVGFACGIDVGSRVAEIVELDVDAKTGLVRISRVVVAQESGLVINPDGITNQIEGGIIMGLGPALREMVHYEKGRILTDRYSKYPIPTIRDAPKIETVLVPNPTLSPQGAGEPSIFPISAAVANAIFDATGKRLREMPFLPDRVLAATAV